MHDQKILDMFKLSYFYAYVRARVATHVNDNAKGAYHIGRFQAYCDVAFWFSLDHDSLCKCLPSDDSVREAIELVGADRTPGVLFERLSWASKPQHAA